MIDTLEDFLNWFRAQGPSIGMIPAHAAVHRVENVMAVRWVQYDDFQIQMFACPPNTIIPEHTHPNVDSFEVYAGGQIQFSHGGKWVAEPGERDMGLASLRGEVIRVRPDDIHGGVIGPEGGVFFSVQHWLNGEAPHCVSADYDGLAMGEHHKAGVMVGDAITKKSLTWRDAASAENAPPVFSRDG
jgi:hypothetical protein